MPAHPDDAPEQENGEENLRTEYAALASYFGTVVTLRFTILGLYVAAVGLVISSEKTDERAKGLILLGLTVPTLILELRNRSVYRALVLRGIQIESHWGYRDQRAFQPFYQRMSGNRDDLQAVDVSLCNVPPPPRVPTRFLLWERPLPEKTWLLRAISHTFGIDLLFLFVTFLAIFAFAKCL